MEWKSSLSVTLCNLPKLVRSFCRLIDDGILDQCAVNEHILEQQYEALGLVNSDQSLVSSSLYLAICPSLELRIESATLLVNSDQNYEDNTILDRYIEYSTVAVPVWNFGLQQSSVQNRNVAVCIYIYSSIGVDQLPI